MCASSDSTGRGAGPSACIRVKTEPGRRAGFVGAGRFNAGGGQQTERLRIRRRGPAARRAPDGLDLAGLLGRLLSRATDGARDLEALRPIRHTSAPATSARGGAPRPPAGPKWGGARQARQARPAYGIGKTRGARRSNRRAMTRERDQDPGDALTAFLDEREREGYRVESHTHTQAIIGPPDRRRTLRRLFASQVRSSARSCRSVGDGEVSTGPAGRLHY